MSTIARMSQPTAIIERSNVCKYGLIDADDGKDNGNRAKYYNLETMHHYGVGWKHVDDAEDKEKL